MYTQQDQKEITNRLTRYWVVTLVILAGLIALYVYAMKARVQALAMAAGCAMFAELCYAWLMYLWPCHCYARFLHDMKTGLTHEMEARVVEVSKKEEYHDGARVLPVRIFLFKDQDERIVYVNVSKADAFPAEGSTVKLKCFGRHIKEFALES